MLENVKGMLSEWIARLNNKQTHTPLHIKVMCLDIKGL